MESHVQLQSVDKNDVLLNRYKVEERLGGGGFSQVFRVKDLKTRQVLAMKISGGGTYPGNARDDEFTNVEIAIKEVRAMKKLSNCPGKGKSLCVFMTDWHYLENRLAILFPLYSSSVTEIMNNLDRRPFTWENVVAISYQLVHAVNFLHENGVTHMDIKPQNLMLMCADYKVVTSGTIVKSPGSKDVYREFIGLRNPEIKLIDFGSSLNVEDKGKPYFIGVTDEYRAPEFILKNNTTSAYDIWSVGCTILELYHGNPLFPICSNDVHLIVIQKVVGEIPERLTKNRPLPIMTDTMVKVASSSSSLSELISWGPKDRIYLYELLKKHLLQIDPAERTVLKNLLDHSFFSTVPNYIQRSMETWQSPEVIGFTSMAED